MVRTVSRRLISFGLVLLALGGSAAALFTNGGFENGDFTGWTRTVYRNILGGLSGSQPYTAASITRGSGGADWTTVEGGPSVAPLSYERPDGRERVQFPRFGHYAARVNYAGANYPNQERQHDRPADSRDRRGRRRLRQPGPPSFRLSPGGPGRRPSANQQAVLLRRPAQRHPGQRDPVSALHLRERSRCAVADGQRLSVHRLAGGRRRPQATRRSRSGTRSRSRSWPQAARKAGTGPGSMWMPSALSSPAAPSSPARPPRSGRAIRSRIAST